MFSRRQPRQSTNARLHAAVSSTKGVPVQLFYENFSLARIYDVGEHCQEVTDLLFSDIPQLIENDYLWSICDGDFSITGHLWLPQQNEDQVAKYLNRELPRGREKFFFTPDSIDEAQGRPLFATHDEFVLVMKEQFPMSPQFVTSPSVSDSKPEESAPTEVASVEKIDILPDRFGRLRPIIFAYPYWGPEDFLEIALPRLDDLQSRGYEEGDVVKVSRIGPVFLLGCVVDKTQTIFENSSTIQQDFQRLHNNQCPHCAGPLTLCHGEFYCDSPHCGSKNVERMFHACNPMVLDFPFSRDELEVLQQQVYWRDPYPLIRFLNSGREDLYELSWDEEDMRPLMKEFTTRHNQLYGRGCSQEVQLVTQGKFLDALSLSGLYKKNIRRLQYGLAKGYLSWKDLPKVLTDPGVLVFLGIPPEDAREISQAAQQRIGEISAFAIL